MSARPRLLDLCCGQGGAAMGYHRAGFAVVGVDLHAMARYPFEFIQADALDYVARHGHEYDVIHASFPCQLWSQMTSSRPGLTEEYPDLLTPGRKLLDGLGLPYVLENVPGAPIRADVTLCGQMFGLDLYRHRHFESNLALVAPAHPGHVKPASKAGHWRPGTVISVAEHVAPIALAREAMGIDWMTRDGLAEAIPPAYTECVGAQLLDAIADRAA